MKILIPILALVGLTACSGGNRVNSASAEPIVVVKEVAVAVTQPCVPDTLRDAPEYVDTKEKLQGAADAAERYQLVLGGRAQRIARLNELEPLVAGCPRGRSKP